MASKCNIPHPSCNVTAGLTPAFRHDAEHCRSTVRASTTLSSCTSISDACPRPLEVATWSAASSSSLRNDSASAKKTLGSGLADGSHAGRASRGVRCSAIHSGAGHPIGPCKGDVRVASDVRDVRNRSRARPGTCGNSLTCTTCALNWYLFS